MCECHQPTKQCQLVNEKTKAKATKECEFVPQNMKLCISHNGCKSILDDIMGCSLLPTMGAMKEVDPHGFNGWPQMQCVRLRSKGWEKPNLVHI
jgi:hypothetical protein